MEKEEDKTIGKTILGYMMDPLTRKARVLGARRELMTARRFHDTQFYLIISTESSDYTNN